jgi:hypothetical protein
MFEPPLPSPDFESLPAHPSANSKKSEKARYRQNLIEAILAFLRVSREGYHQ